MPGRFLEIPVFLGDYFIMPHPVYVRTRSEVLADLVDTCIASKANIPGEAAVKQQ